MNANPNLPDPSRQESFEETVLVPEEDAGIVLRTLRQICDIRREGEDKALFAALLRARGGEAQAELFDYLDGLSTQEIERFIEEMEQRIKGSRAAA